MFIVQNMNTCVDDVATLLHLHVSMKICASVNQTLTVEICSGTHKDPINMYCEVEGLNHFVRINTLTESVGKHCMI